MTGPGSPGAAPGRRRIAITREISPRFAECELTHLERREIDLPRAHLQHRAYQERLAELGCELLTLRAEPQLPDSVFVEDTAVVVDELAVLARPGAASRRPEVPSVGLALRPYLPVRPIQAPGTLDGGDVLRCGRRLWVGRSSRTNRQGIHQLAALLEPLGYSVQEVPVERCLHLKSAVTRVADDTLLINPAWIDAQAFDGCRQIAVDPGEPFAANALPVGATLLYASAFPRTRARLESEGLEVAALDLSELAKAEGAVTCCSLVLEV